jgi:hypothetical protein
VQKRSDRSSAEQLLVNTNDGINFKRRLIKDIQIKKESPVDMFNWAFLLLNVDMVQLSLYYSC